MSIAGLLISAALVAAGLIWIGMPLLRGGQWKREEQYERQRDRLVFQYERAVQVIRDLDDDLALGKMQPEDHQTEREIWVQRAVILLEAIKEMDARMGVVAPQFEGETDQDIDAAIEAAVAQRLRTVNS